MKGSPLLTEEIMLDAAENDARQRSMDKLAAQWQRLQYLKAKFHEAVDEHYARWPRKREKQ